MSEIRDDRRYSTDHEWALSLGGGLFRVGISDHAQHQLGDVVFVELPAVGRVVVASEAVGVVESVKTVSDVLSPLSGTITKVNEELGDRPEAVNQSPYDEAWIYEIDAGDAAAADGLLDAAAYRAVIAE
ncbi:MAG: glycine cleavage system protein GcvH [Myxococcota bacterium]|jgi:glycine cleavage system H protein|nr:glycine cleavage system protein GcvH [Myxococcota bacterium]